jgi:ABC-2 type transport system permease protein
VSQAAPSGAVRGTLAALPAMLRVRFSETLAWRAELLVWVLAYTMPLIMLALWTAVAREAPVGRFGEQEFRAYFLATLVIRMLVASWVVWEMSFEIRQGQVAGRLLRPVHPLVSYAAQQAAAVPLRIVMATPIAVAALAWIGPGALTDDWRQLAVLPLALLGAWLLTFSVMALIGSLAFFWESALGVFDVWLGLYTVFSGYVMPLELFPPALRAAAEWLPFRAMLSLPVEAVLGLATWEETVRALGVQWAWAALFVAGAVLVWEAGARRYSAFGG